LTAPHPAIAPSQVWLAGPSGRRLVEAVMVAAAATVYTSQQPATSSRASAFAATMYTSQQPATSTGNRASAFAAGPNTAASPCVATALHRKARAGASGRALGTAACSECWRQCAPPRCAPNASRYALGASGAPTARSSPRESLKILPPTYGCMSSDACNRSCSVKFLAAQMRMLYNRPLLRDAR